jgi:hypothetical protein
MNIALITSSVILLGASLFDGVSTVHFLKNPNYQERNPLLGKRPSTARVYLEGSAIIATEIGIGIFLNHITPFLGCLAAAGFGVQSYLHLRYGIKNLKLPI